MNNKKRTESLAEQLKRLVGQIRNTTVTPKPQDPIESLRSTARQEDSRDTASRPAATQGLPIRQTRANQRPFRYLVIGLDFGTSCTKVVIRDPETRNAWAVPFPKLAPKGNPFLLPSRLTIGADRRPRLGGTGESLADLKVHLMTNPEKVVANAEGRPVTVRHLCVLFMGLVLREARTWFLASKSDVYAPYEISWELNVGIPSSTMDDAIEARTFGEVARAGWWLSTQEGSFSWVTIRDVDTASRRADFQTGIAADAINVYPEIAAEVTGYARSDARQTGLHLMVDVGASTLDVSSFTLFRLDGLDNFSFWEVDVQKLGAFYLYRHRIEALERLIRKRFDPLDMVSPIPDTVQQMLPTTEEMGGIDNSFARQCQAVIGQIVVATKKDRNPKAPQFVDLAPLPVFFCGGGSRMGFYKQVLGEADRSLHGGSLRIGRFDIQELPRPPRFTAESLPSQDYHRLAVAYGLSFRFLDLAQVTPPSRLANFTNDAVHESPEMIGKEQV